MAQERALAIPTPAERWRELQAQLAAFPQDKFNWLVPTSAQEISPLFRPVVTAVRIDPQSEDVYQPAGSRGGALAFHAHALQRLSNAMAVTWEATTITKQGRWTWLASSAGWWVHPNGERIRIPASYTLDAEDDGIIAKRAFAKAERALEKDRPQERLNAERDIDSYRQFGQQRAETGARSRVIRAICGMKGTYTAGELQKPFVVVLFRPDERNPEVAKALTDRIRDQDRAVFGKGEVVHELPAGHGDAADEIIEAEKLEALTVAAVPKAPVEPPIIHEESPAPAPAGQPQQQPLAAVATAEQIVARYRSRVETWREQLTATNGAPWSRTAREKAASERQIGMVAGMIQKALQLSDDDSKAARRAILAALWGAFNDYSELNSDQVSATIDWAKSFPQEVAELFAAVRS